MKLHRNCVNSSATWSLSILCLFGFLFGCSTSRKPASVGMFDPAYLNSKKVSRRPSQSDLAPSANAVLESTTYSFQTSVTCDWSCGNTPEDSSISKTTAAVFDPVALHLSRGNGGFYSGLSSHLQAWGERVCFSRATHACSTVKNLMSVSLISMKSGQFKAHFPLACENGETVFSPFEPTHRAEAARSGPSLPQSLTTLKASHFTEGKLKNCKSKVQANLALGDCVEEKPDGNWLQTLATPHPSLQKTVSFCADELSSELTHLKKSGELTPAYLTRVCRDFSYNTLLADAFNPGTSCAAFRAEIDCDDFVSKLLK